MIKKLMDRQYGYFSFILVKGNENSIILCYYTMGELLVTTNINILNRN